MIMLGRCYNCCTNATLEPLLKINGKIIAFQFTRQQIHTPPSKKQMWLMCKDAANAKQINGSTNLNEVPKTKFNAISAKRNLE